MKYALLILLTLLIDPPKIGKVNSLKSQAKESYQRGEYKDAVKQYKTLTDSLGVREEEVSMNLAHSYFHLNDTAQAQNAYLAMTNSANNQFKSVSYQQLGVLAHRSGKLEEALNYFKSALKADPSNEEARYNYEMVKKKIEEQKKQQEQQKKDDQNQDQKDQKDKKDQQDNKDEKKNDQQKKDQEKKDQEKKDKQKQDQKDQEKKDQEKKEKQNQEKQDKDKEKKEDTPQNVSDKLKEMKISEEKAKMVLEAMKNQEVQYLQQNKRKATKPKSKGKPDW